MAPNSERVQNGELVRFKADDCLTESKIYDWFID